MSADLLQHFREAGVAVENLSPGQVERVMERARAAWPDIQLDTGEWARFLAQHLAMATDKDEFLLQAHVEDLYLCAACLRQEPHALDALERQYAASWPALLGRIGIPPEMMADLLQDIRVKLLVGKPGRPPALRQYSGRGTLSAFLGVVVTREGRDAQRSKGRERPSQSLDSMEDDVALADPHLQALKERYRAEFAEAFEACVKKLPSKDRDLLRYHYVDGLTIDEMAPIYQVHRSTVARWIAGARDDLFAATRTILMEKLRLLPEEFESLMRFVRSELHVSISEHLKP